MIAPKNAVATTVLAEHGGWNHQDEDRSHPVVRADFSTCLNAFGPSRIVREAVMQAAIEGYPDPRSDRARKAIGNRHQRPTDEIVLGAGASELIFAACMAFVAPGDEVLIATPAFGEYARSARLCGARVTELALRDVSRALLEHLRPRLFFLASPSSPVGMQLDIDDVARIATACSAMDTLLVFDQSYDAFSARSLGCPALPGHPNVLHLRSLTKDHALAGVRVAFAACAPAVASALERARVPWSASSIAQAAAVAAMTDEAQAHVRDTIHRLRDEAARIATWCRANEIATMPSSTHYQLLACSNANATRDWFMKMHAIAVRSCASFGLPAHFRIAARTPAENDLLLHALSSWPDKMRSPFVKDETSVPAAHATLHASLGTSNALQAPHTTDVTRAHA